MQDIREAVKLKYGQAIKKKSCCSSRGHCCESSGSNTNVITDGHYLQSELDGLPEDLIATSFGCGNPIALIELYPGEMVLDLGSGAGLDVLLSARRVGPNGKAYGLDMTDEMLEEARANQQKTGIRNAEFLKGHLEDIPLPECSVDVIISNCVINLSPDKEQTLNEAFRVLKPGGRFAVSDIVLMQELPDKLLRDISAWAGCIAGAMSYDEYRNRLEKAGFDNVSVEVIRTYDFTDQDTALLLPGLSGEELEHINGSVVSAFIRAVKPRCQLRTATPEDTKDILALLEDCELTTAGIHADVSGFIVADYNGIVGIIGAVQDECGSALLRSLAVKQPYRKLGIANALLTEALRLAAGNGIKTAYLLTYTAEEYFSTRGFKRVSRCVIPAKLLAISGQDVACADCSTCMKLDLSQV